MKRKYLMGELSDWINSLDSPLTLDRMKALQLQDLLIGLRKELLDMDKQLTNDTAEKDSELTKQVKAEIAKKMAKLKIEIPKPTKE